MISIARRQLLLGSLAGGLWASGCSDTDDRSPRPTASPDPETSSTVGAPKTGAATGWAMPAEDGPHERTWMCWPSSTQVWGEDLVDVQDAIARVAEAIAAFEPVTLLCRQDQVEALRERLADTIDLLPAPVDDLWARDTLPNFLTAADEHDGVRLAAGHVQFNGWGDKQVHDGDAQLATIVAEHLGIPVVESGLVGEGGGLEVDGHGTVLAARSSWVNANRNPGSDEADIAAALTEMLGAERVVWIDGLAGADITDGHIDTLARFVDEATILVDTPAFDDADDPWVEVAAQTRATVEAARTVEGATYEIVEIVQPEAPRGDGADFLATYMNYYVCNGAVIAPEFGDEQADAAAKAMLGDLFPGREIVMLDIDALAAGGGGIHCATQQQPRIA